MVEKQGTLYLAGNEAFNADQMERLMKLQSMTKAMDALVARCYATRKKSHMLFQLESLVNELEEKVPRHKADKKVFHAKSSVEPSSFAKPNTTLDDIANRCSLLSARIPLTAPGPYSGSLNALMKECGKELAQQYERHYKRAETIQKKVDEIFASVGDNEENFQVTIHGGKGKSEQEEGP